MQYEYLHEWVGRFVSPQAIVESISIGDDYLSIHFKRRREYLFIYLGNEQSFLFWESERLPIKNVGRDYGFLQSSIVGSQLVTASIEADDRVIMLHFIRMDMFQTKQSYTLIIEMIPRYVNVILAKKGRELTIVDSFKRYSYAENPYRQVLPGITYQKPPTNVKTLSEVLPEYPIRIDERGKINHSSNGFNDSQELFSSYYHDFIIPEKLKRWKEQQERMILKDIARKKEKLQKQEMELLQANDEQKWYQYAELLKPVISDIHTGQKNIELIDYFTDGFPKISIPLIEEKPAKYSLQLYIKKFKKAQTGRVKIQEQIEITRAELLALEDRIAELEWITDYHDIAAKKVKEQAKNGNSSEHGLKKIILHDQWEIIVGRTAKENDFLTTKVGKPWDWWFHSRIYHGTHVLLRNFQKKEPPDTLKLICARLAAYYSKARTSNNVPVDFTEIRYVRKPKGAATGYVIYKNYKSLFVEPLDFRSACKVLGVETNKIEEN